MNRSKQLTMTGITTEIPVRVRTAATNAGPTAGVTRACLITAAALTVGLAVSPLAGADPAELAENARCTMCHSAEARRVGPSWAAIAERYADNEGAVATLTSRARAGGSGEWGKAPMPPVIEAQLSDADLEAVIGWILNH